MLSANLPEDLMSEIMTWLPVESLLRFKCVSKSWYAQITDSSFISQHLQRSSYITKTRRLKLVFHVHRLTKIPYIWSLISKEQPCYFYVLDDLEPLLHKKHMRLIYGHCNGIDQGDNQKLLLSDEGHLFLWNPRTRKDKIIPESPSQPRGWVSGIFGFGRQGCLLKEYNNLQV